MAVLPVRLGRTSASISTTITITATATAKEKKTETAATTGETECADPLQTLCEKGQLDRAMDTLSRLRTPSSTNAYISLLKACNQKKALVYAKRVNAHLAHHSAKLSGLLGDYLVVTLAKCGAIEEAVHVSLTLPHRTVFSWTAIISAYSDSGCGHDALKMYQCMQEDGVEPNHYTFVSLFKACGRILDLIHGKKLHADACRKGFVLDVFVGNTLVSMYGKCGALVDAEDVFRALPRRNIVSWNAMLSVYVEQGQGEKALLLHRQMKEEGMSPDRLTFVICLQACAILAEEEEYLVHNMRSTKMKSLQIGQGLHAHARGMKDLALEVFVTTALLSMYSKCGAIVEAENVFSALSQHDVVLWNAMISGYVGQGLGRLALQSYRQMQEEGVPPNQHTLTFALQACGMIAEKEEARLVEGQLSKVTSLEIGRALHADAHTKELASDVFVGTALLGAYGKCGAIGEVDEVFDALSQRDLVAWNAMLSAYVEQGHGEKALQLYRQMQEECVNPSQMTFVIACQACSTLAEKEQPNVVQGRLMKVMSFEIGQALNADARQKGISSVVATAFTSLYGKCGAVLEAEHAFSASSQRDIVSWSVLVSAYAELGQGEKALQLYRQMQEEGMCPNQHTLVYALRALRACSTLAEEEEAALVEGRLTKVMSLEIGQALHADASSKDFASDVFVGTALLSMYGECGTISEAEDAFGAMSKRDIVSWNGMLSAYNKQGEGEKTLQLYRQMQEEGMHQDQMTVVIALQACGTLGEKENALVVSERPTKSMNLAIGQALHADAHRKKGYASDILVGNTLVSMYSKCGATMEAENVFALLSERYTGSWNSMLLAYVEQGRGEKALQLYRHMQEEGIRPNPLTFVIALQACGTLGEEEDNVKRQSSKAVVLEIGQALHSDAVRQGYESNIFVANMLMTMYGKCGTIREAEDVFSALSQPVVNSWNAMLSAYIKDCQGEKALLLYRQMQKQDKACDGVTLVCILQACSETGSLESCKQFHFDIVSTGYDLMPSVAATLIHTYGSCTSMLDAWAVFDKLPEPDIVLWTACIAGHGGEGDAVASLHMFENLKVADMKPDEVLFSLVLLACSRTGLVVQGIDFFESMSIHYGIAPGLKHYGILIDLLGRAGDFKRVENMLATMPMKADLTIWLCLLGACRTHGNLQLAELAFDHLVNLQSKQASAHVLMWNMYAVAGLQEMENYRQCG